jgi:NAD(P)-dependent dehydrogenase (short-subunit alcohol dehydrogenase family)
MQRIHPLMIVGGAAVAAGLAVRSVIRSSRYMSLRGRVVLITGGSRGLGLLLARECARRGARLAICARDESELYRARDELIGRGAECLAIQCDIGIRPQVQGMIDGVLQRFGQLDILINNAGTISVGPVETMTLEDYELAMRTHFAGPLYTTLSTLPHMKARREGRIVNITSIGGKTPAPHLLPYTASKFALVGFSEGLRAELVKDNIFVTTVVPGLMRTGSPRNAMFKSQHRREYAWFSTADVLPLISMSATRMARRVVNATENGDAELILPWAAKVGAKLHGLFPGLAADLSAVVNSMLPQPGGIGTAAATGAQSDSDLRPAFARRANERAARASNQLPAGEE